MPSRVVPEPRHPLGRLRADVNREIQTERQTIHALEQTYIRPDARHLVDILEELELDQWREREQREREPSCIYCTTVAIEVCGLCSSRLCEEHGIREGHGSYCPDCLGYSP